MTVLNCHPRTPNYCYLIEMTNALERRERGDAVIIPVILRPCAWHQLRIGKLLAATVEAVSRSLERLTPKPPSAR